MLDGDGSFRSDEITRFRDSADFVITNPPFSLFRDFIEWIMESGCKFSVIGSINAVCYKEVFPHIKNNNMRFGFWGSAVFLEGKSENKTKEVHITWYTNIKFDRKTKPLELLTMQKNLDKNPKLSELGAYLEYENYNAIEVPRTEAIPSDYNGVMGVPISFLDKYNSNQFKIVGLTATWDESDEVKILKTSTKDRNRGIINGKIKYARILIKHKNHLHKTKT